MRFLNFHAAILTLIPVLGAWALFGGTLYYMFLSPDTPWYTFNRNRHGSSKNGYIALKGTSLFLYAMVGSAAYFQGAAAATQYWFEARNKAEILDYQRPTPEEVARNDIPEDMPAL